QRSESLLVLPTERLIPTTLEMTKDISPPPSPPSDKRRPSSARGDRPRTGYWRTQKGLAVPKSDKSLSAPLGVEDEPEDEVELSPDTARARNLSRSSDDSEN